MLLNKVTVVIPFYNANEYLQETVNSIIENKEHIHEIIIVLDKGSKSADSLESKIPIKVLKNRYKKGGAGSARAYGYNNSKTRYVCFLDADDIWLKGKIEKQIGFMKEKKHCFSFHSFKHFSESNNNYNWISPSGLFNVENFLKKKFTIGCLTVMIDKEQIKEISPNYLKMRNDALLWFQLMKISEKNNFTWGGFEFKGALHRLHGKSLSSSRLIAAFYYYLFLKKCEENLFKRLIYFFYYAYNSIGTR